MTDAHRTSLVEALKLAADSLRKLHVPGNVTKIASHKKPVVNMAKLRELLK